MGGRIVVATCVLFALLASTMAIALRLKGAGRSRCLASALLPASQLCAVAFLIYCTIAFQLPGWLFFLVALSGVVCVAVDARLFREMREAERKELADERVRLLEEQVVAQRKYERRLQGAVEEARQVRADVLRQLADLDEKLERNEPEKLAEGLEDALGLLRGTKRRYCAHGVVDALVAIKAEACERAVIRTSFALEVPEDVPLSNVELCAVFSNLLDNAFNACERVDPAQRFIDLACWIRAGFLTIDIANSCNPRETRAEQLDCDRGIARHGWGVSIVRGVAEHRHGALTIEESPGIFRVTVVLSVVQEP